MRPDLVMVRMPGFGLDGPWRDHAGVRLRDRGRRPGSRGSPATPTCCPFEPYCVGDPNAGLHALFGLLLALEHRDRTGEGGLVEAAMVDAALNVAAEQVIEHSAYGALLERAGNRGPVAAPQNLYQAAGADEYGRDDSWVAIAVATDEQWAALRERARRPGVGGRPGAGDRRRAGAGARPDRRAPAGVVPRPDRPTRSSTRLWDAGVPVGKVVQPHRPARPAAARSPAASSRRSTTR